MESKTLEVISKDQGKAVPERVQRQVLHDYKLGFGFEWKGEQSLGV